LEPEGESRMPEKNNVPPNETVEIDFTDNKDWREIIRIRSLNRFRNIMKFLIDMNVNISDLALLKDQTSRRLFFKNISEKQISVFINDEEKRYKKKYPKTSYIEDISEGRTKNSKLFRIIEWDKAWLFVGWIKQRIIDAQEKGDLEFLKRLGLAISKKPQTKKLIMPKDKDSKKIRELILNFMGAYIEGIKVRIPNREIPRFIKEIYEVFLDSAWFPDELRDYDYFQKFLRRHNII
jgi:translation initiation factor 2 beta subunit (eIF-2beta)/eIF-5